MSYVHTHTQTHKLSEVDTFILTVLKSWMEYMIIFKETSTAKSIFVNFSVLLRLSASVWKLNPNKHNEM